MTTPSYDNVKHVYKNQEKKTNYEMKMKIIRKKVLLLNIWELILPIKCACIYRHKK